jgi:hypothetical protein
MIATGQSRLRAVSPQRILNQHRFLLYLLLGLAQSANAKTMIEGLQQLEEIVGKVNIAREYASRAEDQGSGSEYRFQTESLPSGEHWNALITSLKDGIEAIDVPEPDISRSTTVGDILRATDPKKMRDAVSNGVATATEDVELANQYTNTRSGLNLFNARVEASRKALNTLTNKLREISQYAVVKAFAEEIWLLSIDTGDLVKGMDGLLVAIREKAQECDSKAGTFPLDVSRYLDRLQELSNAECAGLNRALAQLSGQIRANGENSQAALAFAREWSEFVRRHDAGQTTASEDERMTARREEMLEQANSGNDRGTQLQEKLSDLQELSQKSNADYRRLQVLRTQLLRPIR